MYLCKPCVHIVSANTRKRALDLLKLELCFVSQNVSDGSCTWVLCHLFSLKFLSIFIHEMLWYNENIKSHLYLWCLSSIFYFFYYFRLKIWSRGCRCSLAIYSACLLWIVPWISSQNWRHLVRNLLIQYNYLIMEKFSRWLHYKDFKYNKNGWLRFDETTFLLL